MAHGAHGRALQVGQAGLEFELSWVYVIQYFSGPTQHMDSPKIFAPIGVSHCFTRRSGVPGKRIHFSGKY